MKVYVVLETNENTDYNYCGVYATADRAEARIDEIVAEFFKKDRERFYIQEEEV